MVQTMLGRLTDKALRLSHTNHHHPHVEYSLMVMVCALRNRPYNRSLPFISLQAAEFLIKTIGISRANFVALAAQVIWPSEYRTYDPQDHQSKRKVLKRGCPLLSHSRDLNPWLRQTYKVALQVLSSVYAVNALSDNLVRIDTERLRNGKAVVGDVDLGHLQHIS
jgi:hypothetical protein